MLKTNRRRYQETRVNNDFKPVSFTEIEQIIHSMIDQHIDDEPEITNDPYIAGEKFKWIQ